MRKATGHKRKYRIQELLDNLPRRQYIQANRALPIALGIHVSTWTKYKSLPYSSTQYIPDHVIAVLAKFFGVKESEIRNYEVPQHTLQSLRAMQHKDDADNFCLNRVA